MSEAIEKTAAGATRSLFGALGFILLMLGLEMMTEKAGIQLGLGLFLSLLGALCFYAFFFWESAKKVLSAEAQLTIGNFAQSRYTWLSVMLLVFQVIIFSRFIDERRWPFSYPADPAIFAENAKLRNTLNERNGALDREKEFADKWRFASSLRQLGRACRYRIQLSARAAGTINFWHELFRSGGWNGDTGGQSGGGAAWNHD